MDRVSREGRERCIASGKRVGRNYVWSTPRLSALVRGISILLLLFAALTTDGQAEAQVTITQVTNTTGNGAWGPSISADGSRIAFLSFNNLTGGNSDLNTEFYLWTQGVGFTQITNSTGDTSYTVLDSSINADGSRIAFLSDRDLTPGSPGNADGSIEIFLWTSGAGITQITDSPSGPMGPGNWSPSINADGSRIAFHSSRDLTGGNPDGNSEIFLWTQGVGLTQITNSTAPFMSYCTGHNFTPSINADGTRIAFVTGVDYTTGNNDRCEIFLWTQGVGFTKITDSPASPWGQGIGSPSINADGTRIAFDSYLDLTGGNPDGNSEIFLWTQGVGLTQITNSTGSYTTGPSSALPVINADGTRIAFISNADLTDGNPDGNSEIFLWTQGVGFTQITDTDFVTGGGQGNFSPSINANGTRIAFQSWHDLTGGNPDHSTEIFLAATSLLVSSIQPGAGGDTGVVSATIFGGRYVNGTTVKLVKAGQPDIIGDPVTVAANGVSLTATFDLTGKARDAWDVVVTNPDGTSATLPGGFTIEEGRAPQLWVDIIGRDAMALGRNVTYQIQSRNDGNIDATDILIWVAVPEGVTVTTADVPYLTALGPQPQDPPVIQDGYVYLWFYTDKLRPSESKSFRLGLSGAVPGQIEVRGGILEGTSLLQSLSQQPVPTAPNSRVGVNVSAGGLQQRGSPSALVQNTTLQPGACSPGDLVFKLSDSNERAQTGHVGICVGDGWVFDIVPKTGAPLGVGEYRMMRLEGPIEEKWAPEPGTYLGSFRPPNMSDAQAAKAAEYARLIYDLWITQGRPDLFFLAPPIISGASDCVSEINTLYRTAGYNPTVPDWVPPAIVYELMTGNIWPEKKSLFWKFMNGASATLIGLGSIVQETKTFFFQIAVVRSWDPNDKVGIAGYGPVHYVAGSHPLQYVIFFENQETATAPAQEVVITDQLDPTTMDLATLSLGPITFGDWEVTPPAGLTEYTTDVDLRPDQDLLVRIHARLDPDTGLLTWRFTSIDPATGQLPEDPLAGFLPPNVTPPEGDGSVLFTVRPKANLPTGTEVRNQANIIFDANAPILTPVWLNTLDNSKPQSQVLPLATTQSSPTFPVQWTGTDEGAGIKDFSLLVSEDGGPFTPWLLNTPDTSATFTGQLGHQYAFYSIARDHAGNLEAPLPIADASTATPPGPDLTGAWNPVSQSCRRGQCSLQGSVQVVNQGNATAPAPLLRVLLSDDAVLDPGDPVLGESSIRSLLPGGSRTSKVKVKLPLGVSASGKYLFAVLDPVNGVAETIETNNTLRYGPLP